MNGFGPIGEYAYSDSPYDGLTVARLYEATGGVFINDKFVEDGTQFYYSGIPGLELAPVSQGAALAKQQAITGWLLTVTDLGSRHIETLRLARSLGYTGATVAAAETFIATWLAAPAAVTDVAAAPSIVLETGYQGPPKYQDPLEKWPEWR